MQVNKVNYNIGVDFDNTIVSYADIMHKTAVQWGLIEPGLEKDKKEIRDRIRELPDGETTWQKIQAYVYGKAMDDAVLVEGVREFFHACKNADILVSIISHKTEYAAMDEDNINLRQAALRWMKNNRFFESDGLGLSRGYIYFESTRQGKIDRIKQVGCTHFIDDLQETFSEKTFPVGTIKILYSLESDVSYGQDVTVMHDWTEIYEHFFTNSCSSIKKT